MEAVGYDLYLKLLNEAVAVAKGEKPEVPDEECLIDVQVQAHIPEKYIENLHQRLDVYRRIADIRSESDADDVVDELIDRFGDPPLSVTGLVDVALLRNRAAALHIREIRQTAGNVLLYVPTIDKTAVGRLVGQMKGRVLVSAGTKPYISVKLKPGRSVLSELKNILAILADV
jgi:transcription-repair coupling factor (superfamily II helicase)